MSERPDPPAQQKAGEIFGLVVVILLAEGILEEKTRPSETEPGKLRTYKALTDAGLRYGINRVQQQVAETSPRYFEDSFEELVSKYLVQD